MRYAFPLSFLFPHLKGPKWKRQINKRKKEKMENSYVSTNSEMLMESVYSARKRIYRGTSC